MKRVMRIDVLVEDKLGEGRQRVIAAGQDLSSDFDSDRIDSYEIVVREIDGPDDKTLAVHQRNG